PSDLGPHGERVDPRGPGSPLAIIGELGTWCAARLPRGIRKIMHSLRSLFVALWAFIFVIPVSAHELTLALQATGTAKWELAAMQALGLDRAHDLTLTIRDVADSRAGQIALQAGEADVIH